MAEGKKGTHFAQLSSNHFQIIKKELQLALDVTTSNTLKPKGQVKPNTEIWGRWKKGTNREFPSRRQRDGIEWDTTGTDSHRLGQVVIQQSCIILAPHKTLILHPFNFGPYSPHDNKTHPRPVRRYLTKQKGHFVKVIRKWPPLHTSLLGSTLFYFLEVFVYLVSCLLTCYNRMFIQEENEPH